MISELWLPGDRGPTIVVDERKRAGQRRAGSGAGRVDVPGGVLLELTDEKIDEEPHLGRAPAVLRVNGVDCRRRRREASQKHPGVRVNAIAPGPVETSIFDKAGMSPEMVTGLKEQLTRTTPLGRMGRPEEIAHWAVVLADPMAAWMTGKILGVDGGMGT